MSWRDAVADTVTVLRCYFRWCAMVATIYFCLGSCSMHGHEMEWNRIVKNGKKVWTRSGSESISINEFTVLLSVDAFRPAHSSPNRIRNPCTHCNKSFRTAVLRRWYDFVRPNGLKCARPCNRNGCSANMSTTAAPNCRTNNTDTIMLSAVLPPAIRMHWTFRESHWMHQHRIL